MMPALRHNEWLVLPKVEGWAHQMGLGHYQRGDIVVFKPPREATYEWTNIYRGITLPWSYRPYLIKRVIGLPGDKISIRAGRVSVNGKLLAETTTLNYWNAYCHDTQGSLANSVAASPSRTGQAMITVPPGHYFVMGDNRSPGGSLDSRMFGPVNAHDIAARAVVKIWPLWVRTQANPTCDGTSHPELHVKYSGKLRWNPELLINQAP